ncbi:HET-domain-containing protein [Mytilinidion resinicola]|uniref:HET-domain-containing protein n=1 Tax=Mytilinidion resinicola TaxID=574789 RepID=A0A6A6YET0_9PEZI|nr:HET-domain-containing protein [Mytilinidion resinicola]KAF2807336.1 HET-domain-containing protein [Mytilinidion resinicola]
MKLIVIDCKSRTLVDMDNSLQPYLSLSYIWGQSSLRSVSNTATLPEPCEKTIEDSMVNVIALGFRYMWVDRYCIPQDNINEKHSQIQRMGDIVCKFNINHHCRCGP